MKSQWAYLAIVVLLVGAAGAASVALQSVGSSISSSTTLGACSGATGVYRSTLTPQSFGEATTYQLPRPLKAPNSIVAAPDGSIWFGEVTLRGVAHLYANGTLLQYPWPPSLYSTGTTCYDLNQLWGLVMWKGMVWASDHTDDQLIGLNPSNDTFRTIGLKSGEAPLFLAIDPSGNLWFTTSAEPAQIGVVDSATGSVSYFRAPAAAGEFAASLTFYNSSLAYLAAVSSTDEQGQVLSFDPLSPSDSFQVIGANQTLLAPYSVAVADGGLWVGEHDASDLAFYNLTSRLWSFYPTSLNPEVPLTLPYYLLENGTDVWFNEHDSNRMGEVTDGGSALDEYNMSLSSLGKSGIGNALTIGLDGDLAWFTEWTGNSIGFVNASITPPFSLSFPDNSSALSISPGSSASITLTASGETSATLSWQFSDSESHAAVPVDISAQTNVTSLAGLHGSRSVQLSVSASSSTLPGNYILLETLTDGYTFRSVYIHLTVT